LRLGLAQDSFHTSALAGILARRRRVLAALSRRLGSRRRSWARSFAGDEEALSLHLYAAVEIETHGVRADEVQEGVT
jgi:hypothetical protein